MTEQDQEALDVSVQLLEARGPALGFPHSFPWLMGFTTIISNSCERKD